MKFILGIDPGKSGSIIVLKKSGEIVEMHKMPETPMDILDILKKYENNAHCFLEKVHGRPGMGGASMFTFGNNFGHIQMALLALKIKADYITPQKWMKEYQMVKSKSENSSQWKNRLKEVAQRLYPNDKIILQFSDALLIAEYGRRVLTNQKS